MVFDVINSSFTYLCNPIIRTICGSDIIRSSMIRISPASFLFASFAVFAASYSWSKFFLSLFTHRLPPYVASSFFHPPHLYLFLICFFRETNPISHLHLPLLLHRQRRVIQLMIGRFHNFYYHLKERRPPGRLYKKIIAQWMICKINVGFRVKPLRLGHVGNTTLNPTYKT